MMNLHLFSMPGADPLQNVVTASKPHLAGRTHPVILYLPAAGATLISRFVDITRTVFANLAEVEVLDLTQPIKVVDIESVLERTTVLYIPGGNTYSLLGMVQNLGKLD